MTRKRTARTPKPTIPADQADWPRTLPAMVRISPARAQEIDSKLVAASRLVTRLQTQIRLLAQELRDAEAERDHLSQVAEAGEEGSLVPVRYEVRGTDLCAVRDDPIDWRPDRSADPVLARRPATPEDRTGTLPFDKPAQATEPIAKPGDLLFADPRGGVMTADGTHVGHVTGMRADGVMVVERGDTPTGSANHDLPSSETKSSRYAVGDRLVLVGREGLPEHEVVIVSIDRGSDRPYGVQSEADRTVTTWWDETELDQLFRRVSGEGKSGVSATMRELAPHEGLHAVAREGKVIRWSSESPDVRMSRPGSIVDGLLVLNGGKQAASMSEQLEVAGGAEHEPSLAVNENQQAPVDFSELTKAADEAHLETQRLIAERDKMAAADAMAAIAREARKSRPKAEEAEPVRDRVCRAKKCRLAGAETALSECIACGRPTSPKGGGKAQEGGKTSLDTAAGIRQLLVERLGGAGAKRAESEARAACAGVKPDEELIGCADIGGVDEELRKLLVRLLELEPAAKKAERKGIARVGSKRWGAK